MDLAGVGRLEKKCNHHQFHHISPAKLRLFPTLWHKTWSSMSRLCLHHHWHPTCLEGCVPRVATQSRVQILRLHGHDVPLPVQNSQGSERSKQVICSNSQRSKGTGHKTWCANPRFKLTKLYQALSALWAWICVECAQVFYRRTWLKGTDPLLWHYHAISYSKCS